MSIKQTVDNIIHLNLTNFPSDQPHFCKYCGREVPKLIIPLFGEERIVQPVCKCEADAKKNELKRFQEHEEKRKIEKLFSISNLGKRFEGSTFESYQVREGSETAYKETRKYVMDFDNRGVVSLLLWGTYGNGKSHLAAAVANELKARGKTVVFQSVPELLERIRKTFNKDQAETEDQIMTALLKCDLLILDDIGAEKLSDWVSDVLFRIIDGRYRRNLPILYTSNLKPSELLDKLGGRIYDRILETTLPIHNKATSYREEQARKRLEEYRREP